MSNFVKPQSPIYNKSTDTYIYPLTTSDQVIMPNGKRLDDNVVGMQMELLWENASPTSEFAAQTLNLDLSEYALIAIQVYINSTTDNLYIPQFYFIKVDEECTINFTYPYDYIYSRAISMYSPGELYFWPGTYHNSYGSNNYTIANNLLVPIKIYGIK